MSSEGIPLHEVRVEPDVYTVNHEPMMKEAQKLMGDEDQSREGMNFIMGIKDGIDLNGKSDSKNCTPPAQEPALTMLDEMHTATKEASSHQLVSNDSLKYETPCAPGLPQLRSEEAMSGAKDSVMSSHPLAKIGMDECVADNEEAKSELDSSPQEHSIRRSLRKLAGAKSILDSNDINSAVIY